ncbi:phage holin family protein [Helicobacter salomonis]|uniref:phage holin family protein n=1 Tax=Helicobacter salomonis TaxID=56878 RepID=UPI000CF12B53|nr:phage holin family protein [Helicobacter salomonis]
MHAEELLELLPIMLIGLLSGALSYFNGENVSLKKAFVVVCTSSFICLCVYSMLSATNLPYLAKVGLSASVGYFGIDKALEILKNILNLKK